MPEIGLQALHPATSICAVSAFTVSSTRKMITPVEHSYSMQTKCTLQDPPAENPAVKICGVTHISNFLLHYPLY